MAWHVRPVAATLGALLLLVGCGPPRRSAHQLNCAPPWNAGSRLPGVLNPAYPAAGLYPAPGGRPTTSAPGISLHTLGPALVVDYGQPLESGGVTTTNEVVSGTSSGGWWRAPLAAGYPFRLFGPDVPIFGLVPGPVLSGSRAGNLRSVWLVTEWDAAQTLTLLSGTAALAASTPGWKLVPPGVDAAHAQQAAAQVRAAHAAGWKTVATVTAAPACGGTAVGSNPFGDRAELKLPLDVPLMLVSPEYGSVVLEVAPS